MPELTLEALAARIDAIEKQLAAREAPAADWRSVVGMFTDRQSAQQIDAEGRAWRDARPEEGSE